MSSLLILLSFGFVFLIALNGGVTSTPLAATPAARSPTMVKPPQDHLRTSPLASTLDNLGFHDLAMAVSDLYKPESTTFAAVSGPITVFAPSDESIRSCGPACSPAEILRRHLVRGYFPISVLSKLAPKTKLPTFSYPGPQCVTLTSNSPLHYDSPVTSPSEMFFISGVRITRPDLFNDGRIVIHGLLRYVGPLSPSSCDDSPAPAASPALERDTPSSLNHVMLHDAMVRLRHAGFSILSLAIRLKYAELVHLRNMTIFTLDDAAIFTGGLLYVTNVRFHIIPNRKLMLADLEKLPSGTVLPTLVRGQYLVLTHDDGLVSDHNAAGAGEPAGPRINYVSMKVPEVIHNDNLVVHSLFVPFPHLYLLDAAVEDYEHQDGLFTETDSMGQGPVPRTCISTCSRPSLAPGPAPVDFRDDGF